MAQSNLADCLPTNSTEENERQPDTSGDNDAGLNAEDETRHARDKDFTSPTATIKSVPAEGSAHLEQTFEQSDDGLSSNVRSTSQRGGPATNEEPRPERISLEGSAGVEDASQSNDNAAGGDQEFSKLGAIILGEMRDQFLFMVGAAGTKDADELSIIYRSLFPFSIMIKHGRKVDLVWSPARLKLSVEVADAIRDAWPRHRKAKGMEQFLVESDGTMPVSRVSLPQRYVPLRERAHFRFSTNESLWHKWCLSAAQNEHREQVKFQRQQDRSSLDHADTTSPLNKFKGQLIYCKLEDYKKEQHMFPLDQLASVLSYDEPFLLPPSKRDLTKRYNVFNLERLLSFLGRDFQGLVYRSTLVTRQTSIHFQLRYFCPINKLLLRERGARYPCFLGDRQRAIIGRGSAIQYLEEKRARVSLRVSPLFPGLFNIFILADEDMSPKMNDWISGLKGERTELDWARYGLMPCGKGTSITHFMFEVSRVLERSFDAWNSALDSIDKLVHVNLSDFEDEKRVEDLMFDKSFTRSKDYFVAIQLLRITDEWLDELLQSIDDLRDVPDWRRVGFCLDEAEDNINVAIKVMKERATRFQNRVRKKSEEIKSLRDGLFNATSLREATKAMALNQAIYVFTVVTVLFTPVSFLATFWALPFLNNPVEEGSDMVPEPSSFRSTFVTLPLLTYALVIGIAWYMRPDKSRYRLPDRLVGMWDMNSAWKSFSLERKRTRRNSLEGYDTEVSVQEGSDTEESVCYL